MQEAYIIQSLLSTIKTSEQYLHCCVHLTGLHCADMAGLADLGEL